MKMQVTNMDDKQKKENKGQRKAVRASDRILFSYKKIAPADYEAIFEDYRRGIPFYNQPGLAEAQMYVGAQNALVKLRERDADLGIFLQHLDTKMNVLLQKVMQDSSPFEGLTLNKVNISATGMAFAADEKLAKEQILALHIALLPEYSYIFCYARVVNCEAAGDPADGKTHRVSAEFILITEADKERIIQHNFRQQSLALRNRRLQP